MTTQNVSRSYQLSPRGKTVPRGTPDIVHQALDLTSEDLRSHSGSAAGHLWDFNFPGLRVLTDGRMGSEHWISDFLRLPSCGSRRAAQVCQDSCGITAVAAGPEHLRDWVCSSVPLGGPGDSSEHALRWRSLDGRDGPPGPRCPQASSGARSRFSNSCSITIPWRVCEHLWCCALS